LSNKNVKHIYNLKKDKVDKRDYLFKDLAIDKTAKLPTSVDLRSNPKMPPVFDQGNLGSCSSNSTVSNVMYLLGNKTPMLSRLYHYWEERNIEGTVDVDNGAMLSDACKVAQKIGICEESLFPYDITKFTDTPTNAMDVNAIAYKIKSYHRVTTLTEIKQALSLGFPLSIGMEVFSEMESEKMETDGFLTLPKDPNNSLGNHAVQLIAYCDTTISIFQRIINFFTGKSVSAGYFTCKNSWGTTWGGQKGYFTMPYEYMKYISDIWLLQN